MHDVTITREAPELSDALTHDPAARLQAAIEILDEVIASARDDGPPADTIVTRYFKQRRYAGSKDRRAVRELVFRAIRRSRRAAGERARGDARALRRDDAGAARAVRRSRADPSRVAEDEAAPAAGFVPAWLVPELSPLVGEDEWPALLERAPFDLRVNAAGQLARRCSGNFDGASRRR